MPLLEIACFNVDSALVAQAAGADRIELCRDQHLGGTTPLLSEFQKLKKTVQIPVNVMIRPKGGGFVYGDDELRQMERELVMFLEAGADGFVFGILDEGRVDAERCRYLVQRAKGRPCTFHRAFDEIPETNMLEQLGVLIECEFRSVLTSGGMQNAVEGSGVLKKLVDDANGRISVIVGGGVRSTNLQALKNDTGAEVFHSSAIVVVGSELTSKEEITALKDIVRI